MTKEIMMTKMMGTMLGDESKSGSDRDDDAQRGNDGQHDDNGGQRNDEENERSGGKDKRGGTSNRRESEVCLVLYCPLTLCVSRPSTVDLHMIDVR